jgi:hypothetical protein
MGEIAADAIVAAEGCLKSLSHKKHKSYICSFCAFCELGQKTEAPKRHVGPAIVSELFQILAVDQFRLLCAASFEECCTQVQSHRLSPVGRFNVLQRVLKFHRCFKCFHRFGVSPLRRLYFALKSPRRTTPKLLVLDSQP